ncbi:MAG: DNA-processing protein DprA [Bacteroidales bacterium]|nr:DNA-processing protein DprA [Bacteroidales bacterium]
MEKSVSREAACACALGRIFGFEPLCSLRLMEALGSARAVFDLPAKALDGILGPFSKYKGMITREAEEQAGEELEKLAAQGCGYLPYTSPDYPALLKECADPPAGLYFRSSSDIATVLGRSPAVGVVGTRDISPYGREWTPKLVRAMSECRDKPVIVSGLAYGVDASAHIAAMDSGLPTVAVLPVGIDDIYPKQHARLAERIESTPGCAIITDYPPGTGPTPNTFLRRNRIIAGLSNAVLITESKIHGGGLITCHLASEYGREVYALPGRIDDPRSAGCNALIGQKLAEAVWSPAAFCEDLGLGVWSRRNKTGLRESILERFRDSSDEEKEALVSLALRIKAARGATMDELCHDSGIAFGEVSRLAGLLEAEGFIAIDLLQRCTVCYKI